MRQGVGVTHLCGLLSLQYIIMKKCQHPEEVKELPSEHPCAHHLDSITNMLLCLLYHISVRDLMFLTQFGVKLSTFVHLPSEQFNILSLGFSVCLCFFFICSFLEQASI